MTNTKRLAADAVILHPTTGDVLLLERNFGPYDGSWVLPGGKVETNETARSACVREVKEEAGIDVRPVEFVGLYDDPDRGDDRGIASAAYLCIPNLSPDPEPREEAYQVEWFDRCDLPEMGFDHADIASDALRQA